MAEQSKQKQANEQQKAQNLFARWKQLQNSNSESSNDTNR
ncbi:TPA: hypothetical protein PJ672_000767 [Staphylococcus aureus]|uniref:Uncharacterized protein n=1 Tax=Staphylococcus aureus TaxID=1280 RepID=A0A5F0HGC4_STAAU|nr:MULTISPECIES: hypothetical protein [Staphylococcus]HDH6293844.1 hypothetical protein [Staphylococcus aureus LTCF-1-17]HDK9078953.1 hypothetical protein [Staphylococcus aureus USA600-BAA1754]ALH96993.1 hypothetical protein ACH32_01095 [Staphylococcus aureus]AMQ80914.1 hypothetical protein CKU_1491 [Staphylococcus aureus]ATN60741.1 hypothetical protein AB525_08090 [Staphylococcus aureus]